MNGIVHSNARSLAIVATIGGGLGLCIPPRTGAPSQVFVSNSAVRKPLERLERLGVQLREPALLLRVVEMTPEIVELLVDTVVQLKEAFGDQATFAIEPDVNPESIDPQPHVFVVTLTSLPFIEADQILDSVLLGWWAENHVRANYLVSLGLEFT
jgi:hypothetical protein